MSKNVLFGRFAQKPLAKFVHLLNKIVKLYLKFFLDFDKIIKIMNIEVVFMSKTYVKKEEKEREVPLYLFHEGSNSHAYEYFGAHRKTKNSVVFRVWAPDAEAVSLVGDFNDWDVKATPMTALPKSGGVWECVVDGIKQFEGILKEFDGVIISISHDRKYIEEVCDAVYRLEKDGLKKIEKQ